LLGLFKLKGAMFGVILPADAFILNWKQLDFAEQD
jgi:hypothetical protein